MTGPSSRGSLPLNPNDRSPAVTWTRAQTERAAASVTPLGGTAIGARPDIVHSLQLLRGIAAVLVLMRHAAKFALGGDSSLAFPVGQAGVDVFFVISGAVIFLTSRHLSWHAFIRRRIARIVPLYWLVLAAAVAASILPMLLGGDFKPHGGFSLSNAIASYFFIPAFDAEGEIYPLIVAGWTLNFEMYFYAICMLALLILPRRVFLPAVSLTIVAGIVIGLPYHLSVGEGIEWPAAILLLPITLEFVAGLWIAHLWTRGYRTPLWVNAALIGAAILWLVFAPDASPYTIWRPISWGVPAIALVWALMASEEKIDFSTWRVGRLLGDASYAIYLTHPIVLVLAELVLRRIDLDLGIAGKLVLAIVSSLMVGILVHLIVERRLVRFANFMLGVSRSSRGRAVGSPPRA